ncbi:hypothetical protein [Mycolicibacterium fluoranthenivorans]
MAFWAKQADRLSWEAPFTTGQAPSRS